MKMKAIMLLAARRPFLGASATVARANFILLFFPLWHVAAHPHHTPAKPSLVFTLMVFKRALDSNRHYSTSTAKCLDLDC